MAAQFILWLLLLPGMIAIHSFSNKPASSLNAKSDLPKACSIPEDMPPCINSGDLILREGFSWISNSIITILDEPRPISHVGILVKENGNWQVLHTLAGSASSLDGLRIEPLNSFLKESSPGTLLVVRPKGGDAEAMVCEAKKLLDTGIPFDEKFDLTDKRAFYCAEFVNHVMDLTGYPSWLPDTLPNGKPYLGFRHLYDERFADIIFDAADAY